MRKIFKVPENWELFEDDIFLFDDNLNKEIEFIGILEKYFTVDEYKVLVYECQDIDYVVDMDYRNKLEQLYNDDSIILVDRPIIRDGGVYQFFARKKNGKFEILESMWRKDETNE